MATKTSKVRNDDDEDEEVLDIEDEGGEEEEELEDIAINVDEMPDKVKNQVWPEKLYDAVCTRADYGRSKNSGRLMYTWGFKVKNSAGKEQNVTRYVMADDENQAPFLKSIMKSLNPQAKNIKASELTEYFVGQPCQVRLRIGKDSRDGSKRNEVAEVKPPRDSDE